jgi:hypothetical protein
MAEAYGLQNSIGDSTRINSGVGSTAGSATSPTYGIALIGGASATAGNCVYSIVATAGTLVVSEFYACIGVIPTTVAPVFKFWRRPDGAQTSLAPGGTGDVALTPATLTIPLSVPTPATGNVYVIRFTQNNEFNPGEAFIVELDVKDSGAAATATLGHNGFYYRFNADSVTSTAGAAKPNTGSLGRVYVVTA